WNFLQQRFGDKKLTPETRLKLDSMDWIEFATQIGDRTGLWVDDHVLADVSTVSDLLNAVASNDGTGSSDAKPAGAAQASAAQSASVAPLARPEEVLSQAQRSYLAPLSRRKGLAARAMFALNRTIFRHLFHLRVVGLE